MARSDDELLKRARRGDQQAFRLLVERYEGKVAATVVGMLGHGPDADDVGQEVFVRFFESLDRFRGDAALGTYLTRIAINQSLRMLKRRQSWTKRFLGLDLADEPSVSGEAVVLESERSKLVHAALERLSPAHRAVAVLRLMEGYSTRETASILDVPEGTVMSRLSRALSKLEVMLRPEFESTN